MSRRFTAVQLISNEYVEIPNTDPVAYKAVQSILISCECDTTADLPNMNYTSTADAEVTLVMSSTAHIIEDNTIYEMKSDGTWVIQDEASRMNVYTKDETDQLLEDMADSQANVDLAQDALINRNTDLLADIIDGGAKNKIEMTHAAGSVTRNGVTCTWDPDAGTMTLTGSHAAADSAAIFEFYSGSAVNQRVLKAGKYRITGCPTGGSTSTYRAALTQISGAVDTGNGATFTLANDQYGAYRILVSGNCDFSTPAVFYPMVCPQDAYEISDAFVPFCPTLAELYNTVKSYHS